MSVCSCIKRWHFRLAGRGSSADEFLNMQHTAVWGRYCYPPLPPVRFIRPLPQIPALSRPWVCVVTHQPGRLPLHGDATGSAGPEDSLAGGFSYEQEMLQCTCGMRPFPFLSAMAWEALASQCPAAPLGFAVGGFDGFGSMVLLPLLSQRKCWAAPCTGRATCSVEGGEAAANYSCLKPTLSHLRRLCIQTGPSLRCTGNCQSELEA